MAADPITAIANAIASIGAVAKPFVDDAIAQKGEAEHQKRLMEWQGLMADYAIAQKETDEKIRNEKLGAVADRVSTFVLRLLATAGTPVTGVATCIAMPLDVVAAFVGNTSAEIKQTRILAAIEFKRE